MGNRTVDSSVDTLLDILDQKWPRPLAESDDNEGEISTISYLSQNTSANIIWKENLTTAVNNSEHYEKEPELFTLTWLSDEWETSFPMSTIDPDFGDVLTLYYGFAIAILVLAIIVLLIIIFLCCERLRKSRRRVKFASPKNVEPSVVCSGVSARREVFHNLASQSLNSEMPGLYNISVTPQTVEEYELRDLKSQNNKTFQIGKTFHHGNEKNRLTRVYTSNRWTPDYNGNLVHVAIGNSSKTRRNVVSAPRIHKNRTFNRQNVSQKILTSQPQRRVHLPKFNLAGESIVTSSEPSFFSGSQRRSPEVEGVGVLSFYI